MPRTRQLIEGRGLFDLMGTEGLEPITTMAVKQLRIHISTHKQASERERELEMTTFLSSQDPPPSDILLPSRPHLLSLLRITN